MLIAITIATLFLFYKRFESTSYLLAQCTDCWVSFIIWSNVDTCRG